MKFFTKTCFLGTIAMGLLLGLCVQSTSARSMASLLNKEGKLIGQTATLLEYLEEFFSSQRELRTSHLNDQCGNANCSHFLESPTTEAARVLSTIYVQTYCCVQMLRNLIKPHMKVPYLSHAQTLICDIGVGSGICNDSKYIKATPDFFLCTETFDSNVCLLAMMKSYLSCIVG
ncbi:hypothetical protein EB796_004036 [Bugula neritina]|uniref:Uncharacterized protein n=1 Tax=Bugula neritina TaxID=10212 RepID=A0A7J7KIF5_BUGNE|nr:hypothetical protein EB796_004036 [Bugula neritina]